MLQQEKAEDFVIASGEQHSVCDFVDAAAEEAGISISWQASGVEEKGYDADGNCIVEVDHRYFHPSEVDTLLGDATKAQQKLGWTPKISFKELVAEMMREDLKNRQPRRTCKKTRLPNLRLPRIKESQQSKNEVLSAEC